MVRILHYDLVRETHPTALPFEALQTTSGKKPRYLIQDHAVAYLSSASLLKIIRDAQGRKKHRPEYPLLAYADPVYQRDSQAAASKDSNDAAASVSQLRAQALRAAAGGGEFIPLPETADEAKRIRAIFKAPDKSQPLQLQTAASRSQVLRMNASQQLDVYRYLVFACHGVLPNEVNQINQPALVLSHPDPNTQEDGFLTMTDVFGLQLNTDLISLSACNTGRGEQIKGEGVMGLTRAFMYAGSPAVAVTLWSVETQSAKILNVGMFKHLHAGKTRAQALRAIKLEMLNSSHAKLNQPLFWAPLVVFGDAG